MRIDIGQRTETSCEEPSEVRLDLAIYFDKWILLLLQNEGYKDQLFHIGFVSNSFGVDSVPVQEQCLGHSPRNTTLHVIERMDLSAVHTREPLLSNPVAPLTVRLN